MPNLIKNFFGFTSKDVKKAYKDKELFGDKKFQDYGTGDQSVGVITSNEEDVAVNSKRNVSQKYIAEMNLSAACVNQFANDIPNDITPYQMACILQKAIELKACGAEFFTELKLNQIKQNIAAKLYKDSSQKEFADAFLSLPQKLKNVESAFLENTNMLETMHRSMFPDGSFISKDGTPNESDIVGSGLHFDNLRKNIDFTSVYACYNAKSNSGKSQVIKTSFFNCLNTSDYDFNAHDDNPNTKDLLDFLKLSSLRIGESGADFEKNRKSCLMSMFELNALLCNKNSKNSEESILGSREIYADNLLKFVDFANIYIERVVNSLNLGENVDNTEGIFNALQNINLVKSCLSSAKNAIGAGSSPKEKEARNKCERLINTAKNAKHRLSVLHSKENITCDSLNNQLMDISNYCRTNIEEIGNLITLNGRDAVPNRVDRSVDWISSNIERIKATFIPECNTENAAGVDKTEKMKRQLDTLPRLLYRGLVRSPDYFANDAIHGHMQKPLVVKSESVKPMIVGLFGVEKNEGTELMREGHAPVKNSAMISRIKNAAGFFDDFYDQLRPVFGEEATFTPKGEANANRCKISGENALKFLSYRQSIYKEILNSASGDYFCNPDDVEELNKIMDKVNKISSILTKYSSQILTIQKRQGSFNDIEKTHTQAQDYISEDSLTKFDNIVSTALLSVERDFKTVQRNNPRNFINNLSDEQRTEYMANLAEISANLGGIKVDISLRSILDEILNREEEGEKKTERGEDRVDETSDIIMPPRRLFFNGGLEEEHLKRVNFVINDVKADKNQETGSFGVLIEARRVAESAKQRAILELNTLKDDSPNRQDLINYITSLESRLCAINAGLSIASSGRHRLALHLRSFEGLDYKGPHSAFYRNIIRPLKSFYRVVPKVDSGETSQYAYHMRDLSEVYSNPADISLLKDAFIAKFIQISNKSSVSRIDPKINGVTIPCKEAIAAMDIFPKNWQSSSEKISQDLRSDPDACVRHIIAQKALRLEMSKDKYIGSEGNSVHIEDMINNLYIAIGDANVIERALTANKGNNSEFLNNLKKTEDVDEFIYAIADIAMEIKAFWLTRESDKYEPSKFYESMDSCRNLCINIGEIVASFEKMHSKDMTDEDMRKLNHAYTNIQAFVMSTYPASLDKNLNLNPVLNLIMKRETDNSMKLVTSPDFTKHKKFEQESISESREKSIKFIEEHIRLCGRNMYIASERSQRVSQNIKKSLVTMSDKNCSVKDMKKAKCMISLNLRELADAKEDVAYFASAKKESLDKICDIKYNQKIADFKKSHSPEKSGYQKLLNKKITETRKELRDFSKMYENISTKRVESVEAHCRNVFSLLPIELLPLNDFSKMKAERKIKDYPPSTTENSDYCKELDTQKEDKLSVGDAIAAFSISYMSSKSINATLASLGITEHIESAYDDAEPTQGEPLIEHNNDYSEVPFERPSNHENIPVAEVSESTQGEPTPDYEDYNSESPEQKSNYENIAVAEVAESNQEEPTPDYNNDNSEPPFERPSNYENIPVAEVAGSAGIAAVTGVKAAAAVSADTANVSGNSAPDTIYSVVLPAAFRRPKPQTREDMVNTRAKIANRYQDTEFMAEKTTQYKPQPVAQKANETKAIYRPDLQKSNRADFLSTSFVAENDPSSLRRVESFNRKADDALSNLDAIYGRDNSFGSRNR